MHSNRLSRPSPATAIALLALFVSLGGTTYAVTALPRDSVGTEQIRGRAVTEDELARGAVITSRLADRAVTRRKLGLGTITGDRVAADALTGAQIDESTLSAVPLARDAERAGIAQRAAVADRVERADRADRATTAGTAERAAVADALARVDTNVKAVTFAGSFIDTVNCDPGMTPVGGGFELTNGGIQILVASRPEGAGWTIATEELNAPALGDIYAVCVAADGP